MSILVYEYMVPNMSVLLGFKARGAKHVRFIGFQSPRCQTCPFLGGLGSIDRSIIFKMGPKLVQSGSKIGQNGSKMGPRRVLEGPWRSGGP